MNTIGDRYARLGRCYVELADQFAELDVEHMYLKSKLVELIKTLKASQHTLGAVVEENELLKAENVALKAQHETLQAFEVLLTPECQAELEAAEKAMELMKQTIEEREKDKDIHLTHEDKALANQELLSSC